MQVALHAQFLAAYARLQSSERKQVEDMLTRLRVAGPTPGMRPHIINTDAAPLLSLSANMDVRVLGWQHGDTLAVVHVAHHDAAYAWAERHSMELDIAHTLAFASGRELSPVASTATVGGRDQLHSDRVAMTEPTAGPFAALLVAGGIPHALLRYLAPAQSEEELVDLLEFVAPEWQAIILDAVTGTLERSAPTTLSNIWVAPHDAALRAALGSPLSQWRLFLHPDQVTAVEKGTTRDLAIVGGPGTGKSVVLVHRAVRLASACTDGECVVLVGHSASTAAVLHSMAEQLAGGRLPTLHVVDMVAIGRDGRPQPTDLFGPAASTRGCLSHQHKEVVALLIDEAQDVHRRTTKPWVFDRRPEVNTHLTVAVDFNQSIFSDNARDSGLLRMLGRADVACLSYSYRIPREAGLVATRIIQASQPHPETDPIALALRETCATMTHGFSAEFVRVRTASTVEEQIRRAAADYHDLHSSSSYDIAVIFCGNSSDRRQHQDLLRGLGYDPASDRGILTPRMVKGCEYEYCFVVAPELDFVHSAAVWDMASPRSTSPQRGKGTPFFACRAAGRRTKKAWPVLTWIWRTPREMDKV